MQQVVRGSCVFPLGNTCAGPGMCAALAVTVLLNELGGIMIRSGAPAGVDKAS